MSRSRRGGAGIGVLVAILVVATVAVAGVVADQVPTKSLRGNAPSGTATSGAWFCPHGGGDGWNVTLYIANPGSAAASVRVSTYSENGPGKTQIASIPAGATKTVQVEASDRGASSMVEYFGQWVGAGWVTVGGSSQPGVAAEPCSASAGRSFLLPDNTTIDKSQGAYVIVMNPFDTEAVLSLSLYSEKGRQATGSALTDFILKPQHSHAFFLNDYKLGERTLAAQIQVQQGRVSAASLGISATDHGIRSAIAVPEPSPAIFLPGGRDTNRASLAVLDPGDLRASLAAGLYGGSAEQTAAGVNGKTVSSRTASTFDVVSSSPSTIVLKSPGSPVAAVRRSFGINGDEGATGGATSFGRDWVVLPAVAAQPVEPRLLLTSQSGAKVTLTLLGPSGKVTSPAPISVNLPAARTILAPIGFTMPEPADAVLVHADSGTVVPVFAGYSSDKTEYAVSAGVQMPSSA